MTTAGASRPSPGSGFSTRTDGEEVDSVSFGPLSSGIEAVAFSEWLANPRGGASIVYAQGRVAPKSLAVWAMAGRFAEQGLIDLTAKREGDEWRWIAQRRKHAATPVRQMPLAKSEDVTSEGEPVGEAMMRLIRRCANLDAACPSLSDLARAGELQGAHAARYQLSKLEAAGLVRVDNLADGKRRICVLGAGGQVVKATGFSQPASGLRSRGRG